MAQFTIEPNVLPRVAAVTAAVVEVVPVARMPASTTSDEPGSRVAETKATVNRLMSVSVKELEPLDKAFHGQALDDD